MSCLDVLWWCGVVWCNRCLAGCRHGGNLQTRLVFLCASKVQVWLILLRVWKKTGKELDPV